MRELRGLVIASRSSRPAEGMGASSEVYEWVDSLVP